VRHTLSCQREGSMGGASKGAETAERWSWLRRLLVDVDVGAFPKSVFRRDARQRCVNAGWVLVGFT
jgi:hypothetical protein